MNRRHPREIGRRGMAALAALLLALGGASPALAYREGTLYSGVHSEAVKEMQTALIQLGYLGGTPDGIFGTNTENAVKKFQRGNGLKADGVAGAKTLELIYKKAGGAAPQNETSAQPAQQTQQTQSAQPAQNAQASGLFGGTYTTLRQGSSGPRVTALQQRLIALGYLSGSADGKFGGATKKAVQAFQKKSGLKADGLAGKKTLQALESDAAPAAGSSAPAGESPANTVPADASAQAAAAPGVPTPTRTATAPSGGEVKLLHWFDQVKPSLKTKQIMYIYEPSSGEGWNLMIYSCGRHCDAEPCTAEDTASMLRAFGGKNTWNQKAVYVRLPNGTWTIGATHDMPHMSGRVKDNNFDGHLCVHFLRTMSEALEHDPNYGVSNQRTIRSFWKSITGEDIQD